MKKVVKYILFSFTALWFILLAALVICQRDKNIMSYNKFMEKVEVSQKDDKVGAKVQLKEIINGTGGVKYRYIVKTDCPKWDFETRYMADEPIAWADKEQSAAEVLIHTVQVRYDGTLYASGTYYKVPILGNLTSVGMPFNEWKENLIKQAYQTCISQPCNIQAIAYLKEMLIGLPLGLLLFRICMFIYQIYCKSKKTGKASEPAVHKKIIAKGMRYDGETTFIVKSTQNEIFIIECENAEIMKEE